jgi:two-component system, OmpR family, response regulator
VSSLILVVDDEAPVREMIEDALSLAGYKTLAASDGLEALNRLRTSKVDLIVSDINMPKLDGFQLLESLRLKGDNTPFVLLTASKERPHLSTGFRLGADDFIAKPFGIEELALRVAAILRRSNGQKVEARRLTAGPIEVQVEDFVVQVAGREVTLSPTEFKLLVALMEAKGHVLSKQQLLEDIWSMGFADQTNVVDTYISYLRKKLHTDSFQGIKTIRGFGFKIDES